MSNAAPTDPRHDRFAAVYEANYHRILGYALRRTGRDDAADAVAETFAIAWRRLDDVPEGELARLWLYGVARRVVANHERAERRRERLAAAMHAQPPAGAAALPDIEPNWAAAAFARLSSDERELLALLAWEELDNAALAELLGCSRNAVRIRLHRARRHFSRELAACGARLKRTTRAGHVVSAGRPGLELEDSL